jgi:predicted nucleic acid-binding Zn ribbon protein
VSADETPDEIEDERPLTEGSVTYSSTPVGGKTQHAVDSGRIGTSAQDDPEVGAEPQDPGAAAAESVDLALSALAGAQRIARGRPGPRRPGRRRREPEGHSPGGYSGPGPDETDPQPIGGLIAGYLEERGWERPLAEARIFAEWGGLVGAEVGAHSSPVSLQNGELKVTAESTAWATQLRLLSGTLLARLAAELGPQIVTSLRISGPSGPSWKHGGFSVRGTRGPRDTYG